MTTTVLRGVPATLTWTFNDPDVGDTQSAYEVFYRVAGGGAYTSTGKITSTASRHVFASNLLTAPTYEAYVVTYDTLDEASPASAVFTFTTVNQEINDRTAFRPKGGGTLSVLRGTEWVEILTGLPATLTYDDLKATGLTYDQLAALYPTPNDMRDAD